MIGGAAGGADPVPRPIVPVITPLVWNVGLTGGSTTTCSSVVCTEVTTRTSALPVPVLLAASVAVAANVTIVPAASPSGICAIAWNENGAEVVSEIGVDVEPS